MGGRNTRELTGHTQCHTSLLATSSLGDGPWSIGDIGILDNNQLANGQDVVQLVLDAMRGMR